MNPVLKYRGGKSREIPYFIDLIPNDYNTYIEPFFGGGALYFHLEPKIAIVNDINKRLMTFYRQVKYNYPEMRRQLDELHVLYAENQQRYKALKAKSPDQHIHNANEDLYYKMRDLFNYPDGTYLDGVLYYFINKTSYSGMIRYNRRGEYNVPFGRYQNFNTRLLTEQHSDLLQGAEIWDVDYCQIFDMAQPGDFIFLDPPYDCVFNDYGNLAKIDGFNENEHQRLAEDFRNLTSRTLMVIGKTPLTIGLYKDLIVDEYEVNYSVNIRNRFKTNTVHLVVKNF